jgi:hypothetical protein
MRNLVYNVRYSVVQINSSLLTITLYSSVRETPVYNDTKYQSLSWRYNRVRLYFNFYLTTPDQTGPGAHPASYTMGTGSLSRG